MFVCFFDWLIGTGSHLTQVVLKPLILVLPFPQVLGSQVSGDWKECQASLYFSSFYTFMCGPRKNQIRHIVWYSETFTYFKSHWTGNMASWGYQCSSLVSYRHSIYFFVFCWKMYIRHLPGFIIWVRRKCMKWGDKALRKQKAAILLVVTLQCPARLHSQNTHSKTKFLRTSWWSQRCITQRCCACAQEADI